MDKKQQILHYYRVDRLSLREISRRVSLDRKTVRRIVRGYEEAVAQDPETGWTAAWYFRAQSTLAAAQCQESLLKDGVSAFRPATAWDSPMAGSRRSPISVSA